MLLLVLLTVNKLNQLDSNSFHFRVEWVEVNNIKNHEGCTSSQKLLTINSSMGLWLTILAFSQKALNLAVLVSLYCF